MVSSAWRMRWSVPAQIGVRMLYLSLRTFAAGLPSRFVCLASLVLGICLAAHAQTGQTAGVSRAGRPSDLVGRTGGVYTRGGLDSMQRQRAISDLSLRLGTPEGTFRRGGMTSMMGDARITGPISRDPFPLIRYSYSGSSHRYTPGRSYLQRSDPTSSTIASISGLNAATNFFTPEGGWGYMGPPIPSTVIGAPVEKSTNSFRAFFGLTDPPDPPVGDAEPRRAPPSDVSVAIQEDLAVRVIFHMQSGIALFRSGTVVRGDAIERAGKIARAMSIFETIKVQDRLDWLAPCLSFHAALEREQSYIAIRNLVELCKRYPRYFFDRPDITTYFGEAEFYRAQMRRFRQAGQYNPTSPEAYAIEAYSAWALNDAPRARQALARLAELSSSSPIEQDMRIVRGAIEPALE